MIIPKEERLNVFTHAMGIVLSVMGTAHFFYNQSYSEPRIFLALIVYCFSLIFLFSSSTIYHSVSGDKKLFWRKIDHIAILFLIAGSYTPVTLTVLYESSGILIFKGVWCIVFFGTIFKIFYTGRFEKISLLMYLGMGWLVILDINSVINSFTSLALIYLALGGFFYTTGVYFYSNKTIKETHAIWHVFVLFGALFHFLMINEILRVYTN
ncbi:hemolysin III family protein [Flavobacteriaceae bacterium]|jgi:hemolysin III|nr:hemolysin III family protein [Flavobacteriaceae bacterium]